MAADEPTDCGVGEKWMVLSTAPGDCISTGLPSDVQFARHASHCQILRNAFGNALVGGTRLIRIFDLQVAIIRGEGVQGAAASLLGLVLQFSDRAQPLD